MYYLMSGINYRDVSMVSRALDVSVQVFARLAA